MTRLRGRRRAALPEITYPPELPICDRRAEIMAAIADNQVSVIAGETGSGKTTQLPKFCLELGRGSDGMIGHTQPRRVAARSVAQRIADELGIDLGDVVGYSVRFTDRTRAETLVRVMTDGLLLAETRRDPLLQRYDTIIIDEAHERSLNIDFLLGCLARILPQRPELKLIITSATIDPQRFSRHFGDAPIIEVTGRTYPVEIRYRPLRAEDGEAGDQTEAIVAAIAELLAEHAGDVLVFLSGEREIRATAEALAGVVDAEILPLFSRLPAAEQQKIFRHGGAGRRVILATNVAETSLTVPGIRYVIDPGTARISRHSAGRGIQRLPIEPISQASANQRAGRCGRVTDGVCVRLYSEEDYLCRPRFTDPEILRTNLASVILQMAAAGLGEISDFPFLDPPDRRMVTDGVRLLRELSALDESGAITKLGRRLAELPVDPRYGRAILEADRVGCVAEATIIVAALSIQDPRERPAGHSARADELHARFTDKDDTSDFLSFLSLWRYLTERQRSLSGNKFRRLCRDEFLHYMRVREWQDLVAQLRQATEQLTITPNHQPAESDTIHRALLAGLLSQVGVREPRTRDYLGARGIRFTIWPGSSLARRSPTWTMVAEMVETGRLWGRTAARIDPRWIEPLAGDMLKRSYSEPRWSKKRAAVVATERATLYGLPVITGRTVPYTKIDPVLSRELFIRNALVEGEWDSQHEFLDKNRSLIASIEGLEDRVRRRDLGVTDDRLADIYAERLPAEVVSGRHFDRWWRDQRSKTPDLLTLTRSDILSLPDDFDRRALPDAWKQGEHTLALSYLFDPGSPRDGITVHVPLTLLPTLRATGFDWLVPARRPELVEALLRGLSKSYRRELAPISDTAAALVKQIKPRSAPLTVALGRSIEMLCGLRIPADAWRPEALPANLRMWFRVEDERGALIAEGDDLARLRAEATPRLRAALSCAAGPLQRTGLTDWTISELPKTVALPNTDGAVRGYPALVDAGDTVSVRVLETRALQTESMTAGTARLLALTLAAPDRAVLKTLSEADLLVIACGRSGDPATLVSSCVRVALAALIVETGGPAWDRESFVRLRSHVAGRWERAALAATRAALSVLLAASDLERGLDPLARAPATSPLVDAVADVRRQLDRLVGPGFIERAGAARLGDVERYLRAAERRLERLPDAPGPDRDKQRTVEELEALYRARIAALAPGVPPSAELRAVVWMLEELRVSYYAHALGVRGQVSAKRIRRALG